MSVDDITQKSWIARIYAYNPISGEWERFLNPSSYLFSNYELSDMTAVGDPQYFGYVDKDENWYIRRVTASTVRFAKGSGDYPAAFAGAAGLTYHYYFEITW